MSEREIPVTNEIKMFFHCKHCLKSKPDGISPQQWISVECGWTEIGFQVWCKRCQLNIIHVDFEGTKHRASMLGRTPSEDRIRLVEDEPDHELPPGDT